MKLTFLLMKENQYLGNAAKAASTKSASIKHAIVKKMCTEIQDMIERTNGYLGVTLRVGLSGTLPGRRDSRKGPL